MSDATSQTVYFYNRHPISCEIILTKLRASRGHLDGLRPEELFPHDQDHYGGLAATDELALGAQISNGSRVADFCAGLGGTVRGKLLAWLLGKGIAPHIPVWERYQRTDGMFPRTDFAYDAERDVYICPNDRILRTSGTVHNGRVRNYLSQPGDCKACELKARCTRAPFRKIARDINEEARDYARSLKGTPEFEQSSNERKKVEMRFAHLKVQHRFERMRLRGLTGARDEFILAAIAQNLKTLANQTWRPPRTLSAAYLV